MTDAGASPDTLTPSPLADGLHTARLPNGLRVLILEDHRAPVAVCNVWVRVGSNREPEKLRGWSHGIEHMLFKGTAGRDEGDFAREVAEAGGTTNAGTGYETTNYHITVPAPKLPVAVDILSDVLFHSTFDPESLDAERKVLVHENHMYDDIPFGFGVTWRWGMELAFDESPYHYPIGGRDENLLERGRADILAFLYSAYRPDNMIVVVAGDVDPAAAFDLITEKFGPAAAADTGADPDHVIVADPPTEKAHDGCRLRLEYGDIQRAYAKLIFPGPGDVDGDRAVLSVVRRVLSDGRSCRLYRRVQEEKKLVDDFTVMTETGPREGVILVDLETDPARLGAAVVAVGEVLAELAATGCTEKELDRARVRVFRSFLFGEETVQGRASTIGYHDAIGDLAGAFDFPERVARVTTADVAAFCARTFSLAELSCVIYLPEGTDPAAAGIPTDAGALSTLLLPVLPYAATTVPPPTTPTPETGPAVRRSRPAAGRSENRFRKVALAGGAELCWRTDHAVPVVAMALTTTGGATTETASDAGLSSLTQMTQVKGAGDLEAEALHEALEGEGASVSPRTDRDFAGLFLSGLTERLDRILELTGLMITVPRFSEDEIEQERRLAQEQLQAIQDNPFQTAALELRGMMYGDHPYGRPLFGTAESLPLLTRAGLLACHARNWTADNLQIVVSGSFDPDGLVARLEDMLRELPPGTGAAPRPAPEPVIRPAGLVGRRLDRDQNQSVVLAAWPGPLNPDQDRVPLMLLKEVLNGQSGRLFDRLRNRRSLCYNTGTLSTAGFGQGLFMGYVLTAPESEDEARAELVRNILDLTGETVPTAEFERARSKLLGNLLISSQANSSRVSRTARDRIYGRGTDDLEELIEAVGSCRPDEVRDVAERLLTPDGRYEVTIGPPAKK